MNIEDIKLEIITLQKLDTQNALENNIEDKETWLKECLNKDKDPIAQAIIDLAKRTNIKEENLAKLFDETMIIRVLKEKERKKQNKIPSKWYNKFERIFYMKINIDLNNKILIIPNNIKDKTIRYINNLQKLTNTKIITDQELLTNLTYNYDEKTIIYLMKNKNLSYQNSKELLNNLKYIILDKYNNEKLNNLQELKLELINKKLLTNNNYFLNYLKTKEIYFYSFNYIPKLILEILKINNINYNIIPQESKQPKNITVNLFKNVEEEITYIAEDIRKRKLNLAKTYIYGINKENQEIITRIFNEYNININIKNNTTLYDTVEGKNLLKNLNNIEEYLTTITNNNIKEQIINILNKYYFVENYQDINNILKEELKNTNIKNTKKLNSINEIDIINNTIEKDEYIYIINFNNEYIPVINKDTDYISDKDKPYYIEKSYEKNNITKENINQAIQNIENLTITASKNNINGELNISNIATDYNYEVIEKEIKVSNYSNKTNKYNLALMLDNYIKYGEKIKEQDVLLNTYPNYKYKTYDNTYTKINYNEEFTLSYSKMNSYYECPFKYYCENILHLNTYEDTFDTHIGSLCHYILSKIYTPNFNFEESKEEYLKTSTYQLTNENIIFQNKILEELKQAIKHILSMQKTTTFQEIETERKIETTIDNVKFTGIIDKIQKDENNIILIDYKTGTPKIDLKLCEYGLNLQLPTYLYLIKSIYPTSNIVGLYLQHILKPKFNYDPKKDEQTQYEESLKLDGYTISNEEIINKIDRTYENSTYIKGLKTTTKGFPKTSKLLSEEEIKNIEQLITNKIKESIKEIKNANFTISPKIINKINKSCPNCKYESICHHTEKDNIYIEIKKEEENELDWRTIRSNNKVW